MKRIFTIPTALTALLLLVFAGCEREHAGFDNQGPSKSETAVGYLSFAESGLTVEWDGENVNSPNDPKQQSVTRAGNTDVDSYTVDIVKAEDGSVVNSFAYGERGSEPVALNEGKYYLNVYSGTTPDLAWEDDADQPTYGARSETFEITRLHTKESPKRIEPIVCRLLTVKTTVSMEQAMAAECEKNGGMKISVSLGSVGPVLFDSSDAHRYGVVTLKKNEDGTTAQEVDRTVIAPKAAYMKPVTGENALKISFSAIYEGTPISYERTITSQAKAGEWRKILLFIDKGQSELVGHIVVNAQIETWVYDQRVDVEIESGLFVEDTIPDIDDPDAPRIESPNFTFHDVTEISASDYDAAGNYNKPSSITVTSTSATTRFAVRLSSGNAQLAEFLSSSGLLDTSVNLMDNSNSSTLLARTQLKNWGFPSREAIEDNPYSTGFSIGGFLKFVKDFEGEHTIVLGVTDSENHYSRADIHINVTTGGVSGGDTDTDPNIWWPNHDMEQRHNTNGLKVDIHISANKGIQSLMVEMGGEIEDGLTGMMPTTFDLVDPDHYQPGLDATLSGEPFFFPTGDGVRNKTSLLFDITGFMPLLASFKGDTDFKLTVTDNEGQSITKTVKVHVD